MNTSIEEQLRENGVVVSTTVGVSMKPMLRNRRDRVVLCAVGEERLNKFDLPIYRRPDGKYVLHRIIGVREDHYVIRGDNTYKKEYVPHGWVIGCVTEFYRNGKRVSAESRGYRFYASAWNKLYFLRLPVHGVRVLLGRIKRKLLKKAAVEE